MNDGSDAKREFESNFEKLKKSLTRMMMGVSYVTLKYSKKGINYFRYRFSSPYKTIQKDGRTKEIVKLDIDGGLTHEETKQFLLKAERDGIKVLVKEYTTEDRLSEKSLHAQESLYKNDKKYQKWSDRKQGILGKLPIAKSIVDKQIINAQKRVAKDNEKHEDTRYMIFTNKSNRTWLNETLVEVRDSIVNDRDISSDEPLEFTKDVEIRANEIEVGKEYGIGVEKYDSNYCEVKLPREAYVQLDKVFLVNDTKFGAKQFEGDDMVTVRFRKADYELYRSVFPISQFSVKEIGKEDGRTLKVNSDVPIITQHFKDEKSYFQYRDNKLQENDYIAKYNKDGSVDVKYSATMIVKDNENFVKKYQTLEEMALEEYKNGGHSEGINLDKGLNIDTQELLNDKDRELSLGGDD